MPQPLRWDSAPPSPGPRAAPQVDPASLGTGLCLAWTPPHGAGALTAKHTQVPKDTHGRRPRFLQEACWTGHGTLGAWVLVVNMGTRTRTASSRHR